MTTLCRDQNNATKLEEFNDVVAEQMGDILKPTIDRLTQLFQNENNDIGLKHGNVSIHQNFRPNISVGEAYVTEVRDTKSVYTMPVEYNGLGYNNLINIYMLIKLTEIRKGKDFRILCLEEPEAHLHPALQYNLFKYLSKLDEADSLNQQIFITTHSSNISAVAGIDNMFMLAYERNENFSDCKEQSLEKHFTDEQDSGTRKTDAKNHLAKFLDVTRSDMLFADKVIFVEGIAEKLLLPLFMKKCNCSYENEHISIVEIGGKHFEHFVELFNGNAVRKKVLCITDRDFHWTSKEKAPTFTEYNAYMPQHIEKLKERFCIDNFAVHTQNVGGRTFEDELFLTNITNGEIAKGLFKITASKSLYDFTEQYGFDFAAWNNNKGEIDGRSLPIVEKFLKIFNAVISTISDDRTKYEELFFAQLFLHYAKNNKGNTALEILVNEKLANGLIVPTYIQEGLKWLAE